MRALLLALALAPAAAARAADLEARAAEHVARLEALASLRGPAGWATPAEAKAYCASSPLTEVLLDGRARQLIYACRAYERSDAEECRSMPGAFVTRNTENCLASFDELALFRLFRKPDEAARRRCRAAFGLVNSKVTDGERPAVCAAIAAPGDPASRCRAFREVVPQLFVSFGFELCVDKFGFVTDGRGCGDYHPGSNQRVVCKAFAAYLRPSCGEDYLCRALRGEAGVCDKERSALLARTCAERAAGRPEGPAAPRALSDEIADTAAWAAHLPVIGGDAYAALLRLHEMMLGRRALDPREALPALAAVRFDAVDDLLHRAGPSDKTRELRRRAEKAKARAESPSAALAP